MCSGSRLWCRALVGAVLVTLGASLDLYDQPNSFEDIFYQDGNDIDTGPVDARPGPHLNDVMLRKIIQGLQLHAPEEKIPYRNNQLPSEGYEIRLQQRDPEVVGIKGYVYKRLAQVYGASHHLGYKNNDSTRPQQKWKIKKGKAIGSQMVCYFKLCAFRSPA